MLVLEDVQCAMFAHLAHILHHVPRRGSGLTWHFQDTDPDFGQTQAKNLQLHFEQMLAVRGKECAFRSTLWWLIVAGYVPLSFAKSASAIDKTMANDSLITNRCQTHRISQTLNSDAVRAPPASVAASR